MKNTKKSIPISKLHPFENHLYKVQDNEEMESLAESIKQHGVLSPIIVRPKENTTDEYEIISGHRRVMAIRTTSLAQHHKLKKSTEKNLLEIGRFFSL